MVTKQCYSNAVVERKTGNGCWRQTWNTARGRDEVVKKYAVSLWHCLAACCSFLSWVKAVLYLNRQRTPEPEEQKLSVDVLEWRLNQHWCFSQLWESSGLENRIQWLCHGEWRGLHMMWQPGAHLCLRVPLSRGVKPIMLQDLLCRNVGGVKSLVLKQGVFQH